MNKSILLFADGTGNSAGKLFKTNVWRLYQAVDASENPSLGTRQVSYYHDGVGTSAFKPLQLLGGIFGIGLKRNVIDMYCFVCRNYRPGDDIYLFGFSRGAFTVRVLAALLLTQGIIDCETDELLRSHAADAYRNHRRRYKLPLSIAGKQGFEAKVPTTVKLDPHTTYYVDTKIGLVDRIRDIRDWVIKLWRASTWSEADLQAPAKLSIEAIRFLGVWDTVSAYGMPLEELTRAIDEWIWPLSMPNTELSPLVKCARHALALDEERDSFQPLLWDEDWEQARIKDKSVTADRLKQVWFAGVHSNVGGGYADDALSHVSLEWMMEEARQAGVRYKLPLEWGWTLNPNPFGRLYDSRAGVAGYYRPQTRRLVARLPNPPKGTLSLQAPGGSPKLVDPALIHESVPARIQAGTDRYAPITLPPTFVVVGPNQPAAGVRHTSTALQTGREEWVFDDYWRRRIVYFGAVGTSLLLVAFPFLQAIWPPSACIGPQCALAPLIAGVGTILPSFLSPWIDTFALAPGWFAMVVLLVVLMRSAGARLKARMYDNMRQLWIEIYGLPVAPNRSGPPIKAKPGGGGSWVYQLRTNGAYQRLLQTMKWTVVPDLYGVAMFAILYIGGCFFGSLFIVYRAQLAIREHIVPSSLCSSISDRGQFSTSDPCWPTGIRLHEGQTYRITLILTSPWSDDTIPASPVGISPTDISTKLKMALLTPTRRVIMAGWYRLILRTTTEAGYVHLTTLEFGGCNGSLTCGTEGRRFTSEFVAERSGQASLFVNDAPFAYTYGNNRGTANVTVESWNAQAFRFEPPGQ